MYIVMVDVTVSYKLGSHCVNDLPSLSSDYHYNEVAQSMLDMT